MPKSHWLLLIVMVLLLIVYVGGAELDLKDILIIAHLPLFKDRFHFQHHEERESMSLCRRMVLLKLGMELMNLVSSANR